MALLPLAAQKEDRQPSRSLGESVEVQVVNLEVVVTNREDRRVGGLQIGPLAAACGEEGVP